MLSDVFVKREERVFVKQALRALSLVLLYIQIIVLIVRLTFRISNFSGWKSYKILLDNAADESRKLGKSTCGV